MNITVGLKDVLLASPLIVLFLFSLIPLASKVLRGNVEQNPVATVITAFIGLGLSAGLLILFGGADVTIFNKQLLFDGLTQWASIIALVATAGAIAMMYENPSTRGNQFSELIFLMLNCVLGMIILVSAVNLLTLFIGLELMSLSLYLMIAMSHEQKFSKEAAMKYFVLGSFASAIFLYGVSFIYGSTGGVNITDFMQSAATLVKTNKLFLFGMVFIIIGFCFKVAIAPFHAWTPDVYQGSPTPITGFMATAVKAVSFAAFLRVIATQSLVGSQNLLDVLQWLAVITMTVGNVAAILQTNLKRTLAYSSIAHSGYLLVGLITVGISQNSAYGAASVLFYLFSYTVMSLGAFAIVCLIEKNENSMVSVDDLAGFAKNQPILAFCLTTCLLSMAGIPPLFGFFGKFYLFSAAVSEGLLWLALWGVLNSAIGVYYYLRPIVVMYMREGDCDVAERSAHATTLVAVVSALLVIIIGLSSGPLFNALENSLK